MGTTSCKMEQLTCSMGLACMEISVHALKATTSSKGFLHLKTYTLIIVHIVKYCINNKYFSPLQVERKPCEGAKNVCLFLGLLAWLETLLTTVYI